MTNIETPLSFPGSVSLQIPLLLTVLFFHFNIAFQSLVDLSCYHHRLHLVPSVRQQTVQEIRISTLWFLSTAPGFSSFPYAPTQVIQDYSLFRCVVTLPWSTLTHLIPSFPLLFPLLFPPFFPMFFFFFFLPFLNTFSQRHSHLCSCTQLCSVVSMLESGVTSCVQHRADPLFCRGHT